MSAGIALIGTATGGQSWWLAREYPRSTLKDPPIGHVAGTALLARAACMAPLGGVTPWSAVRMVVPGNPVSDEEVVMIAATDTGLVPMRVSKAVGLADSDDISEFIVLAELMGIGT